MLAPEVWAFEPPANLLKLKEGILDVVSPPVEDIIKSHHFNHLVSVVLPDTPQVPESIYESLTTDCDYYKINNFQVHDLMSKEFIESFIKKGHLTVLSVDTRIDLDDCLALIDSGHLILSLNLESYQELGLVGKPTLSKIKHHQKYLVTLDLTAKHFLPGRKNYDRALKCISTNLQSFNIILTWDSGDEKVCPSSVVSYLHGRGYEIEVCKPQLGHRTEYNVDVPFLTPKEAACSIEDLLEWLGAFSLNINRYSGTEKEYLSSFMTPEETVHCGQVAFLSWEGFFTTSQIAALFKELRDYIKERTDIPWISLYVQGYSDSPISWGLKEHAFYTNGDNSYTILLKPDNSCIMVSLLSNHRLIR